jgi:hypothetical protein
MRLDQDSVRDTETTPLHATCPLPPLVFMPPARPPYHHATMSPYHHASVPHACSRSRVPCHPLSQGFRYPLQHRRHDELAPIRVAMPSYHRVAARDHQSKRSSNPPPADFCAAPLAFAFAFAFVVVVGPQSLLMVCSCSKSLIVFPPVPALGVGFGADPFFPIVDRLVVQRSSNVDPLDGLACPWPGGAAPGEVTDGVEV